MHTAVRLVGPVLPLSAGVAQPVGVAGQAGNRTREEKQKEITTFPSARQSLEQTGVFGLEIMQCDIRYTKVATDPQEEIETERATEDSDEDHVTVYISA